MNTKRFISWLIALSTLAAITVMSCSVQVWAKTNKKSDSTIKVFVEYKLAKAGILTDNNVDVAVANNKITLTGTVPTLYDVTLARKVAGSVDDNYSVINDLAASTPKRPGGLIAKEVMHRIETHVFYTVYDWVTVHVHNGVVTLKGWVNAPWYVREYQDQAERVVGVRQVVNDLKTAIGSDYLKYRATRLVYEDPFYQPYSYEMNPPIHIIVNGGTLILEGQVQTAGERGYLADLMRFRTDAPNVVDNLQIAVK